MNTMIKMYRLYKLTESNERLFVGDFDNNTQIERYILDCPLEVDEYEMSIVYIPKPVML